MHHEITNVYLETLTLCIVQKYRNEMNWMTKIPKIYVSYHNHQITIFKNRPELVKMH